MTKTSKKLQKIVDLAVRESFPEEKLKESQVAKFVKVFKSQPHSDAIQLMSLYLKEVKRKIEETTLFIESATSLSSADVTKIKRALSSDFVITNSEFKLNPSLLGGIKVRIGDHVFEDSIMSRIMEVKEVIKGGNQ